VHGIVWLGDVSNANLPFAQEQPHDRAELELLRLVRDRCGGHEHTDARQASVLAVEDGD
jgi:hypothetical protein